MTSNNKVPFEDQHVLVRSLPITSLDTIPEPPKDHAPLQADDKHHLRKLADDHKPVALDAMHEVIDNKTTFGEDLGPDAPPMAKFIFVTPAFERNAKAIAKLRTLLRFHLDKQEVLANDIVILLEDANHELQHRAEKHAYLLDRYPSMVKYFEMRSRAIAEGKARARKEEDSDMAPVDNQGETEEK